jgi:hypothetical protein
MTSSHVLTTCSMCSGPMTAQCTSPTTAHFCCLYMVFCFEQWKEALAFLSWSCRIYSVGATFICSWEERSSRSFYRELRWWQKIARRPWSSETWQDGCAPWADEVIHTSLSSSVAFTWQICWWFLWIFKTHGISLYIVKPIQNGLEMLTQTLNFFAPTVSQVLT